MGQINSQHALARASGSTTPNQVGNDARSMLRSSLRSLVEKYARSSDQATRESMVNRLERLTEGMQSIANNNVADNPGTKAIAILAMVGVSALSGYAAGRVVRELGEYAITPPIKPIENAALDYIQTASQVISSIGAFLGISVGGNELLQIFGEQLGNMFQQGAQEAALLREVVESVSEYLTAQERLDLERIADELGGENV